MTDGEASGKGRGGGGGGAGALGPVISVKDKLNPIKCNCGFSSADFSVTGVITASHDDHLWQGEEEGEAAEVEEEGVELHWPGANWCPVLLVLLTQSPDLKIAARCHPEGSRGH